MICPRCKEKQGWDHDMEHKKDEFAVHDPGAPDGFGTETKCWLECERCGHQEECEDTHAVEE